MDFTSVCLSLTADLSHTQSHLFTLITVCAEGSIICSEGAVTRVSVVLLHALPSTPAVHAIVAAVALAAWIHPRSHLCSLLQVKGHSIYLQSPHAAQETPLTTRGT